MALTPYREPSRARSLVGLFVTAVPFVALWLLMLLSLRYSYWLCLLLAMPAAGFLVRLFISARLRPTARSSAGGSPTTGSAACSWC